MKLMYKVEEEYEECLFLDRFLTPNKEMAITFAKGMATNHRVVVRRLPVNRLIDGMECDIVYQKQAGGEVAAALVTAGRNSALAKG